MWALAHSIPQCYLAAVSLSERICIVGFLDFYSFYPSFKKSLDFQFKMADGGFTSSTTSPIKMTQ